MMNWSTANSRLHEIVLWIRITVRYYNIIFQFYIFILQPDYTIIYNRHTAEKLYVLCRNLMTLYWCWCSTTSTTTTFGGKNDWPVVEIESKRNDIIIKTLRAPFFWFLTEIYYKQLVKYCIMAHYTILYCNMYVYNIIEKHILLSLFNSWGRFGVLNYSNWLN